MSSRAVAIIIAGFCTVFVAFAIRYSYGLLLPQMLPSLDISKTEAGIIYSSYFVACTLASPFLGLLADRVDARGLLTVFVAVLGLGGCLMAVSSTVVQASIFFALAGIGHSACWAPVVTVVQRWVSEKRRGIAVAVVDLGSTGSIAVWSILIPILTGTHSWRAIWLYLGLSAFLAAGMDFFMVKSHPPIETELGGKSAAPKPSTTVKTAYKAIFRDPKFYLIGLSYSLISFSIIIPFAFLTTYAAQELKIPYQSAAGLLAVVAVSGAIGKLILAHVSDIVGRIKVMMLCGVLTAAGGLGMAFAHEFLTLVLSTVVFGVGYGTIWPVYAASARDMFSKDYSGSVVGLWTLYHGLGSIIAPVISGWTIDVTGTYVWAFILTVISGALSLLMLVPIIRSR